MALIVEQVVFEYAKDRPIIFSTFQPDAAMLIRKLQSNYPVSSLSLFSCFKNFGGGKVLLVQLLYFFILGSNVVANLLGTTRCSS